MTYPTRSLVLSDGRFEIRAHTSPVGPESTLTALDGWYEPEIRVEFSERIGGGVLPARSEWDKRSLLLGGHVSGLSPDGVRDQLRVISAIAAPGTPATLTVDDFGMRLAATVERVGKPRQSHSLDHGWVEWELSMVAPDPHLYGLAREYTVLPLVAGSGHVWPAFGHVNPDGARAADWGTGNKSGGPELVTNQGNATAWPVVTVSGDFPGGFRLTSGVRAVEFGFAVFPQSPVVVDMAGHVWVGGVERSHWLRRREWIGVPPAGSVSVGLDPLAGGSGRAVVAVRDTWI